MGLKCERADCCDEVQNLVIKTGKACALSAPSRPALQNSQKKIQ